MARCYRIAAARVLCGIGIGAAVIGCVGAPPVLRPSAGPAAVELSPGLSVGVMSLSEAPGWGHDDALMLGARYTAVWVQVRNETTERVALDPRRAVVFDAAGTPWLSLDEAQRTAVRRWHVWSWRAYWRDRFSPSRMAELEGRVTRDQFREGWLAPAELRQGLLLFKPMPPAACRAAMLEWPMEAGAADGAPPPMRLLLQCG
jgi:hypothetical protein